MAVIEERLAANLPMETDQQTHINSRQSGINGNAMKLLRLVSALQAEPLTEGQQAAVTELQQGLEALTGLLPSFPEQIEQVVNEQQIELSLPLP